MYLKMYAKMIQIGRTFSMVTVQMIVQLSPDHCVQLMETMGAIMLWKRGEHAQKHVACVHQVTQIK